jgi:hypothetical protein
MARPIVPAWFIAPEPDPVSGILYLTPECKNGHALISFRESGMASAWRGDVWMVCTCRTCSESFLVYLSTGRIPLLNCVGLTFDEARRAYRLDADIPVSDVMLILGFASRPTRADPKAKHTHRINTH